MIYANINPFLHVAFNNFIKYIDGGPLKFIALHYISSYICYMELSSAFIDRLICFQNSILVSMHTILLWLPGFADTVRIWDDFCFTPYVGIYNTYTVHMKCSNCSSLRAG